jgi:hypothetical protein
MSTTGARLLVFVIAFSAVAQERAAWKWTLDERLARRFDPPHMAERAAKAGTRDAFVISGRDNPELFLPSELVSSVLMTFIPELHRARTQAAYAPAIESFGWDPEVFWRDVQMSAGQYHTLLQKYPGAGRTKEISRMMCVEKIAALHELRRKYDRFDEFLYTAVAPGITVASTYAVSAERDRWREGGCR